MKRLLINSLCTTVLIIGSLRGSETYSSPSGSTATPIPTTWEEDPAETKARTMKKTDEGRGNWVIIKNIARKANKLFEQIDKTVSDVGNINDSISKDHALFLTESNEFDIGFQSGAVDERLSFLSQELKKLETPQGKALPEYQRLLKDVQEKQGVLGSIKTELTHLQKIREALTKAIIILDEQTNKTRTYRNEAWKSYEKITNTLSDRFAREQINFIEAQLINIKNIENYIVNTLRPLFAKQIQNSRTKTAKVQQMITSLKAKGIELSKRVEAIATIDTALRHAEEQKKLLTKPKPKPASWWQPMVNSIVSVAKKAITITIAVGQSLCKLVRLC
ncbi:MAG: hypothetical protein JW725_04595 [Candidatus Babeliaceae bacterium]|nr:hypothetical protein [Candidatus Babeliaceae bacterium]